MYRGTQYLDWAIRFYGGVPFDLASSGMTAAPIGELGDLRGMDDYASIGALHRAVAAHHHVPDDEVVATLGTAHALWLTYASLLERGDDVLVEEPAYEPLLRAAEGTGARIVRFTRREDAGFAIDPAEVAAKITPRTRVVCVTNLHNPTGARTSDAVLREVAAIAARSSAHLLVDEVYAPFDELIDGAGTWPKSARHVAANVIAAGSLTKCYGLGTQRIGWLIAPPAIAARARATLLTTCGGLPTSHAAIGVQAFSRIGDLAARSRRLLGAKRARVAQWVASRPDLAWSEPGSGLFGFVRVRGADGLRGAIEEGITEHGVIVAPGEFFELPGGFRLAWTIDDARLAEALQRLEKVLAGVTRHA